MNLKDKILFLRSCGITQQSISNKTGIPQSSISKIENEEQLDVLYSKGVALDEFVKEQRGLNPNNKLTT